MRRKMPSVHIKPLTISNNICNIFYFHQPPACQYGTTYADATFTFLPVNIQGKYRFAYRTSTVSTKKEKELLFLREQKLPVGARGRCLNRYVNGPVFIVTAALWRFVVFFSLSHLLQGSPQPNDAFPLGGKRFACVETMAAGLVWYGHRWKAAVRR